MEPNEAGYYRQIIGKGLDLFAQVFERFEVEALKKDYGEDFYSAALYGPSLDQSMESEKKFSSKVKNLKNPDFATLFNIFIEHWEKTFSYLDPTNHLRTLVFEIKYIRNQWAHQYNFNVRETYRCIDIILWILETINPKCKIEELETIRKQLLYQMFQNEFGKETVESNGKSFHPPTNEDEREKEKQYANLDDQVMRTSSCDQDPIQIPKISNKIETESESDVPPIEYIHHTAETTSLQGYQIFNNFEELKSKK